MSTSLWGAILMVIASAGIAVRAYLDAHAPVGYEDETGFHFGEPK